MGAAELEARVGIDFYEPWLEVLIDHEIESQELEIVLAAVGV